MVVQGIVTLLWSHEGLVRLTRYRGWDKISSGVMGGSFLSITCAVDLRRSFIFLFSGSILPLFIAQERAFGHKSCFVQ